MVAKKQREDSDDDAREALEREFDLPLPNGKSYGRGADIVRAWEAAMRRETEGAKLRAIETSDGKT